MITIYKDALDNVTVVQGSPPEDQTALVAELRAENEALHAANDALLAKIDAALAKAEAVVDVARLPPTPQDAYRYQHARLFQPAPPVQQSLGHHELRCPSKDYIGQGWYWDKQGGDWADAAGVRYGTQPIASVGLNAGVGDYVCPFTVAVNGRCAFLLRAAGASRTIAAVNQTQYPRPRIHVEYVDGTSEDLECYVIATLTGGATPSTLAATYALPVLAEFRAPSKVVANATLLFRVTAQGSGESQLHVFRLDPRANTDPVTTGLNLAPGETHPSLIGSHHYADGKPYSDFVEVNTLPGWANNTSREDNFDPHIWDESKPHDYSKWPHRSLGKFIGGPTGTPRWTKIESTYQGEGFAPLVPGIGALRIHMPAGELQTDGTYKPIVPGGTYVRRGGMGSYTYLFLPEPDFGRLKRLFVRYYMRIPAYSIAGKRYQIAQSGSSYWIDHAGKTGIVPTHDTSFGGFSGSSGGGRGWQMRLSWADALTDGTGGPDEGGWSMGLHTFDYAQNQPPGHNYGNSDRMRDWHFGQRGGLGGVLRFDRWYCVEMELDLNTVTVTAPGFLPDGAVRVWIDGRLTLERTGFVARTLPLYQPTTFNAASQRRACREIGHIGLLFNWFHGGLTPSNQDRFLFITGLAYGRERIGPMRME